MTVNRTVEDLAKEAWQAYSRRGDLSEIVDRMKIYAAAEVDAAVSKALQRAHKDYELSVMAELHAEREKIAQLIEGPDFGYTELAAFIRLSKLEKGE